jgi:glucokinase
MTAATLTAPSPARSAVAPPVLLTVGIDVGGTKTSCVVTDSDDQLILHEVEPTRAETLPDQLAALVQRAVDRVASEARGTIAAVGVAVPGRVEPQSGTIALAVNLGGRDLALGPMLEKSVGLPCFVEHDARAAASWVNQRAGGVDADDLAYLAVGTGISAGIVLNGRVLRGANGLAGEVGHVNADPSVTTPCNCGLRGCLEVVAAGPAIARMAREAVAAAADGGSSRRATILQANATAADVFAAAAAGDAVAQELATAVAERLARAIRGLVLTLGVSHVVIGGGVAAAGDALLMPVLAAIDRERAMSPLVEAAFNETRVELLSPQAEAGARGAAAIARQRVSAEQREGVGDR